MPLQVFSTLVTFRKSLSQMYRIPPTDINLKGIAMSEAMQKIGTTAVFHCGMHLDCCKQKILQPTLILISGFLTLKSSCAKYSQLVSCTVAIQAILKAHWSTKRLQYSSYDTSSLNSSTANNQLNPYFGSPHHLHIHFYIMNFFQSSVCQKKMLF